VAFQSLRYSLLAFGLAAGLAAPAFAATGEALFQQRCTMCHALTPTPGKMGPPLGGVVGRKSGSVAGFNYSPAMKGSKLTWTKAELNTFLTAPMKKVPGTMMPIMVPEAPVREAIIGYLATTKP